MWTLPRRDTRPPRYFYALSHYPRAAQSARDTGHQTTRNEPTVSRQKRGKGIVSGKGQAGPAGSRETGRLSRRQVQDKSRQNKGVETGRGEQRRQKSTAGEGEREEKGEGQEEKGGARTKGRNNK